MCMKELYVHQEHIYVYMYIQTFMSWSVITYTEYLFVHSMAICLALEYLGS